MMTVHHAREAAREWIIEHASAIPGFCGAYTAGSTNWVSGDTELPPFSDMDVMVVVADPNHAGKRQKLRYHDAILEVSYLANAQFQSADQILGDYHLAPSFRTSNILADPRGHLTPLLAAVSRDYAKRSWVRPRCAHARDKVLAQIRWVNEHAAVHDQITSCLFAAGITTHILLTAGLKNPTVRSRYVAVRELLENYGRAEFHEPLLALLGSARMTSQHVTQHLASLANVYDAAKRVIRTPFPFASDLSDLARPIAIDASADLIARGFHREAMFWIAVTHSRCQHVLALDAPTERSQTFKEDYQQLLSDIGLPSFADVEHRCAEIERALPGVCDLAETIIAANS
jgi:hypothetical protein